MINERNTETNVIKELVSFLKDDREKQQQLRLEQIKRMERMMAMMTQVMAAVAKTHESTAHKI